MLPFMTILAILASTNHGGPVVEWSPTNDPSVHYRWVLDPGARPVCNVDVMDTGDSPRKQVSISYRNRSGMRVDLSVRMNPGDPQKRVIAGCAVVDRVEIARR